MSESLDLFLRYQKISTQELAEFREGVEGLVTRATKRARKEDLEELRFLLGSIKNHLNERKLNGLKLGMKTLSHLCLAHIGGSRILESVLYMICDNIDRYFDRSLPRDKRMLRKIYKDLCKIFEAIEARKPDQA